MITEGADILDIGGYSTRPGADEVTADEEMKRTIPVIKMLRKEFPEIPISIDTFRGQVARSALEHGANVVNDVSGWQLDNELFDVLRTYRPAYVLMHMRGTPATMATLAHYDHLIEEILTFLSSRSTLLRQAGVYDIAIDPGIGFSKNLEQNYYLLKNLGKFKPLELPILVGISRKSLIQKVLDVDTEAALNGTTALHMAALMNGAHILRVHDVLEAKQVVSLFDAIK